MHDSIFLRFIKLCEEFDSKCERVCKEPVVKDFIDSAVEETDSTRAVDTAFQKYKAIVARIIKQGEYREQNNKTRLTYTPATRVCIIKDVCGTSLCKISNVHFSTGVYVLLF